MSAVQFHPWPPYHVAPSQVHEMLYHHRIDPWSVRKGYEESTRLKYLEPHCHHRWLMDVNHGFCLTRCIFCLWLNMASKLLPLIFIYIYIHIHTPNIIKKRWFRMNPKLQQMSFTIKLLKTSENLPSFVSLNPQLHVGIFWVYFSGLKITSILVCTMASWSSRLINILVRNPFILDTSRNHQL